MLLRATGSIIRPKGITRAEANMRQALSRALSVVIVAGLAAVLVKVGLDVATNVEATKSQTDGLHVALPYGMRDFPVDQLVALP
jgi:hypothetical protein